MKRKEELNSGTIGDVIAGRLRTPSSLNELASLEISPGLLNPKNFRVPPMLEYGKSYDFPLAFRR